MIIYILYALLGIGLLYGIYGFFYYGNGNGNRKDRASSDLSRSGSFEFYAGGARKIKKFLKKKQKGGAGHDDNGEGPSKFPFLLPYAIAFFLILYIGVGAFAYLSTGGK